MRRSTAAVIIGSHWLIMPLSAQASPADNGRRSAQFALRMAEVD
jgi:hypothetical protein